LGWKGKYEEANRLLEVQSRSLEEQQRASEETLPLDGMRSAEAGSTSYEPVVGGSRSYEASSRVIRPLAEPTRAVPPPMSSQLTVLPSTRSISMDGTQPNVIRPFPASQVISTGPSVQSFRSPAPSPVVRPLQPTNLADRRLQMPDTVQRAMPVRTSPNPYAIPPGYGQWPQQPYR
jgi:hypothetical protein